MNYWLVKTEPDSYSFADFQRDKKTTWDGVANALAQKHIRNMRPSDGVLVYHSGKDRAVIGTATITSKPYDLNDLAVVDMAVDKPLNARVTLQQIKQDPAFEQWELVRISRLSVMPVPAKLWQRILKMGRDATA